MLHAFAEKKGSEVQPIYLLSGNREGYGHTITLVAKSKLAGWSLIVPSRHRNLIALGSPPFAGAQT